MCVHGEMAYGIGAVGIKVDGVTVGSYVLEGTPEGSVVAGSTVEPVSSIFIFNFFSVCVLISLSSNNEIPSGSKIFSSLIALRVAATTTMAK